jgi:membrane protein YdbS with pleckstrin-like domain
MLIAAALSVVIFAFSVWIFLYFSSVKYEKEEGSLKITSGILIKKFTCISTETPYTVVVYHLPFRTGFALIFTYGGMQIILNKEIL